MAGLAWQVQLTRQVRGRVAAEVHAIAAQLAVDHAAAGRDLVADELGFAQTLGPVGGEGTVGRAGDGVFVNSGAGGEEAGDEVVGGVIGRGGGDDGEGVELRECLHGGR